MYILPAAMADACLPVDTRTRFSVEWKVAFRKDHEVLRSGTFCFRNVQYYLELTVISDADSPKYFQLVLRHADHGVSSIRQPFDVVILLEDEKLKTSDVLTRVTIDTVPKLIWALRRKPASDLVRQFYRFYSSVVKFVCIFLDDASSSQIQRHPEGTNSSTHSISTQTMDSNFSSHLESLSEDFGNLLKNESLPDVKLRCGDLIVPAHKLVLTARSEVFAAMFRNEMSESQTGAVNIEDLDEGVFDLFLKYLYSGKIADVPDDVVPGLYAAADKYAVKVLKTWCRELMVRSLTEQNCVGVLTIADAHSDADFKRAVISFMCSHELVFKSEAWLEFCKEPSKLVVEVFQRFAECKIKKS